MAKELATSDSLKNLASSVMEEFPNNLAIGNAKIEYLLVHPNISKTTAGRCIRTNNELKHYSSADYLIEMSADVWNAIDSETQKILMLHELAHIDCYIKENGDYNYGIRDHTIQDFSFILSKFGNWQSKLKTIVASINDVAEIELDNIKI